MKQITGFERYMIDETGMVYIALKGYKGAAPSLKPVALTRTNGYAYVMLSRPVDGSTRQTKRCSVHRMVAKAFIPNPESLPCVNHINFDRADNRVENLEWCTQSHNIRHSVAAGRKPSKKGEESHLCKRTDTKHLEMVEFMLKNGVKALMAEYVMTKGAAYNFQYHYRKKDRRLNATF